MRRSVRENGGVVAGACRKKPGQSTLALTLRIGNLAITRAYFCPPSPVAVCAAAACCLRATGSECTVSTAVLRPHPHP